MLCLDDFHRVDWGDKGVFERYHARYPVYHSDQLFSTMMCWRGYMDYGVAEVDDHLLITTSRRGKRWFRPPVGELDRQVTSDLFELALKEGGKTPVTLVSEHVMGELKEIFPKLEFVPERDYFDYVYLSCDLADMPGKGYLKVRNQLNKFKKTYDHTVEDVNERNYPEVKEFIEEWCRLKDCESDPVLASERDAVLFSIYNLFSLDLSSICMRIDGEVKAVSVYEPMNHETAVVHYEKAMPTYQGIYQAINNETAIRLKDRFRFINRESDMGVEGLRFAKEKYRPHHMEEVYSITRGSIQEALQL